MKANTHSIKSLIEEFQHTISLIKSSDFRSYEEIINQVKKGSIHIPRLIKQLHDAPFSFYRARSEKDPFDIFTVDSFKYPPGKNGVNWPPSPVETDHLIPEQTDQGKPEQTDHPRREKVRADLKVSKRSFADSIRTPDGQ